MSQQQPDFDPWTNSNQSLWGNGNALAVVRAQANVLARAALIIRARAFLEEAISSSATPICLFFIDVACFRLATRIATSSTVTLTPPPSPLISIIFWQCDFVLFLKIQTVFFRTTLLIPIVFNLFLLYYIFYFIILYLTSRRYNENSNESLNVT